MTRSRVYWWMGVAGAGLAAAVVGHAAVQDAEPVVRIISPTSQTVLSGQTMLSAEVTPDRRAVGTVTFFFDGREVCRVASEPFQCEVDAGGSAAPRSVRVVADLVDGRRVISTVRTKGLRVDEAVNVDLILVPVVVTDGRGQFVTGLDVNQFIVLEDDRQQPIAWFRSGDSPVSLLLALDLSGSMGPALEELKQATRGFLRLVRPQDALTLTTFNEQLFPLALAETDPQVRLRAVDRLTPWGATALYDAIITASEMLSLQPNPRALVVFTDGDDVSSRASLTGVRSALRQSNVVLYVAAQGRAAVDRRLREQLTALAAETGGAAWFGARLSALQQHFSQIAADLAHQYVLGYAPPPNLGDGVWRRIEVRLAPGTPRHQLRARQGYTPPPLQ